MVNIGKLELDEDHPVEGKPQDMGFENTIPKLYLILKTAISF